MKDKMNDIKEKELSKTSKLELIACGVVISAVFSLGIYYASKFASSLDLNNVLNRIYYGDTYYGSR